MNYNSVNLFIMDIGLNLWKRPEIQKFKPAFIKKFHVCHSPTMLSKTHEAYDSWDTVLSESSHKALLKTNKTQN